MLDKLTRFHLASVLFVNAASAVAVRTSSVHTSDAYLDVCFVMNRDSMAIYRNTIFADNVFK